MGKRKHTKVRACGLWGVWVCTGLLVVGLSVSVLFPRSLYISYVGAPPSFVATELNIDLAETRIAFSYYPPYNIEGELVSGWEMSVRATRWYGMNGRWWSLPSWHNSPFKDGGIDPEFPMVHPAVLMLGWSLWLMHGRRLQRRTGCCQQCGYSLGGLTSDVCPECGEIHEV